MQDVPHERADADAPPSDKGTSQVRFAGLVFDLGACMLARESGEAIPLTHSEFKLLCLFISRAGRVLSRDAILEAVANRPLELFDRSVDVLVGRLRRKIESNPKAPRLIVTVPGEGYRFDGLATALRGAPADSVRSSTEPQAADSGPDAAPAAESRTKIDIESAEPGGAAADGVHVPPQPPPAAPGQGIGPAGEPSGAPPPPSPVGRSWRRPAAAALAVVLLAAGAAVWDSRLKPRFMEPAAEDRLAAAPRLSIVVLPFENMSADKEQDYFADGITDDLTTDLSHLQDSFVISRGTAFAYKGKPIDAKAIGRELGVRYLMEGSVRRLGDNFEVNARLVSTGTGAQVWGDRFEGERARLGELQAEFISRLANSLGVELVKAEALRAMRERPNNPDAVDLAMRGWTVRWKPVTRQSSAESIALFERALALDPQNVSAMEGLAAALADRVGNLFSEDAAGDLARAEKTIDAALALQPDNSLAHDSKSWVYFQKRQWGLAIAEAEKAIADDGNNADAHANVSFWKMFLGRSEDGFAGVETALRLSPRDPDAPTWQFLMCHLHTHLAQWEQAIEWCRKSITSGYRWFGGFVDLAAANAWAGHDKEAREAVAQLQQVYPSFTVQTWAGIHWSDDPTFNEQYARIVEGLRKAGLPEGDAKKD